jgi:hypothetical protein
MTDRTVAPRMGIFPAFLRLPAFPDYTTRMEPAKVGMKVVGPRPASNKDLTRT